MELSGGHDGAAAVHRRYGPTTFAARGHPEFSNVSKTDRQQDSRGWPREDSSEEEMLTSRREDIIVTTELKISRGSEDASSNTRSTELHAL